MNKCAQRVGHTKLSIPIKEHCHQATCQTWKVRLLLLTWGRNKQRQSNTIYYKPGKGTMMLNISLVDFCIKHIQRRCISEWVFLVCLLIRTCQQKLHSCQFSNVKQITEDEGLWQKLLWKESGPLLTLDGDAFCAGFPHLLSLLCTLCLKMRKRRMLQAHDVGHCCKDTCKTWD